jgi:hypothetical protein
MAWAKAFWIFCEEEWPKEFGLSSLPDPTKRGRIRNKTTAAA